MFKQSKALSRGWTQSTHVHTVGHAHSKLLLHLKGTHEHTHTYTHTVMVLFITYKDSNIHLVDKLPLLFHILILSPIISNSMEFYS